MLNETEVEVGLRQETRTKGKPNTSCDDFTRSYYARGDKALQSHPTQVATLHQDEEVANQTREKGSTNHNYPGTLLKSQQKLEKLTRIERKRERHLPYSRKTSALLKEKSIEWQLPPKDSLIQSGNKSSRVRWSTSTPSSVTSITLPLLKRMWDMLVEQRSLLEKQILLERFRQVATGLSPGMQQPKQSCLLSLIGVKNYGNGGLHGVRVLS